MSFIMNKIEEKIGLDLNKDGRVGGPGLTDKIEKKTHVDFNRDGLGLIGKIERATHIDINRDGYIGGAPGYLPPPQTHKKH
ncbi:unnamed protein product [Adineta steineri]|uniref:Uncharacterized protein n=1 Tax=Adineta steineri TaxID=433720 RepID=A0A814UGE6_9BILA|nr:unnamed protein product [Adineta steineri]CAF4146989.1 unnamed protein product [Adineta steineri]